MAPRSALRRLFFFVYFVYFVVENYHGFDIKGELTEFNSSETA
jgi:hypothetical protein